MLLFSAIIPRATNGAIVVKLPLGLLRRVRICTRGIMSGYNSAVRSRRKVCTRESRFLPSKMTALALSALQTFSSVGRGVTFEDLLGVLLCFIGDTGICEERPCSRGVGCR